MKYKGKKLIGLYEMIGGILWILIFLAMGIPALFKGVMNSKDLITTLITVLVYFIMIALYVMSFVAGLFLWKGKTNGSVLSIIVQALQIPYIVMPGLIYTFISGSHLGVGITIAANRFGIKALVYLGSSSNIYFASRPAYILLGINFIPIIIIAYLKKSKKMLKTMN